MPQSQGKEATLFSSFVGVKFINCSSYTTLNYCSKLKFVPVSSQLIWIACLLQMPSLLVEGSLVAGEVSALRDIASVLQLASSDLGGAWNATADPCTWSGIYCDAMGEHVTNITLKRVGLQGEVPASLANLTFLVKIHFSDNSLGGKIPSQLGTLIRLQYLNLGANNLTGEIPPELGTLKSLQTLYLDSNLLEGVIPTSFGNLTILQRMHLSSNTLTGLIPSELGSLTLLEDLHLDDNGFSGQIPTTFSNLTKLVILLLDHNNLSGALSVNLERLPALQKLSLAMNNFSGQIPQFGSGRSSLITLILCFNKFSGTIPSSIGNIPSLTNLCLSHNNLTGIIPGSFGANLLNLKILDVSHNSLSGSLDFTKTTSWSQQNLASDFSFNYFGSNASIDLASNLRIGDNTLFNSCNVSFSDSDNYAVSSCSQASPGNNSQFAINVGGDYAVTNANNGVTFQADLSFEESVGLQIDPTNTWALQVSDGGAGNGSVVPTRTSIANVLADEVEEIYQSMRWSPLYLAYYGINMQSGRYNVSLYFAEIVFKLPGYRFFDVMVQGELVLSKLDVVKEVGYYAAFRKAVEVNVTDGLLKIELIYAGPNRWLIPGLIQPNLVIKTGPMVSGISVKQLQLYSALGHPPSHKNKWTVVGAPLVAVAAFAIVLLVVVLFFIWNRRKPPLTVDLSRAVSYSYKELRDATDNFNPLKIVGRGAFGTVFRGVLKDKSEVAIKQLTHNCHNSLVSFKKEITILSSAQHRNVLSLRGYCLDAEFPLLVCEYISNGSLADALHRAETESVLGWELRRNIAIGTASGLAYLHHESRNPIIHCDLKPANILLDAAHNPFIADFGLSRLVDDGMTGSHISVSTIAGTRGYLAPEYTDLFHVSKKGDVFSFGVVLLEILSGRRARDSSLPSELIELADWAKTVANELELVDPKLEGRVVEEEAVNMAIVAKRCTLEDPSLRPTMRMVCQMLENPNAQL